jgi:hypothetical protein
MWGERALDGVRCGFNKSAVYGQGPAGNAVPSCGTVVGFNMRPARAAEVPSPTAMRLPLTMTVPLATGRLLARMPDLVRLGGIEFDVGAAAQLRHLVDRHRGLAQNHREIDPDIFQRCQGLLARFCDAGSGRCGIL